MKVCLIDEDFKDFGGHHASYDMPIAEELRKLSIEVHIFVHFMADCSGQRVGTFSPVFTKAKWARTVDSRIIPRQVARLLKLGIANICTLLDLVRKVTPKIRTGDVLLMCRPNGQTRIAYSLWSIFLSFRGIRVTEVCVFHNVPHRFFRAEAFFWGLCARMQKVIYVAHTEPLVALCKHLTGKKCFLLPLPLALHGQYEENGGSPDRTVTFSYLGLAHRNKGLDTLISAINYVRDMLSQRVINLIIQCYLVDEEKSSIDMIAALEAQARAVSGISLIKAQMEPEEYARVMMSADVIVIPHRKPTYGAALSGVFTEALALGKPVIVARGTYMAEQLGVYGGGLTFESGNPESLAIAIRNICKDIKVQRGEAEAGRTKWLETHNQRRFASEFLKLIERAGDEAGASRSG